MPIINRLPVNSNNDDGYYGVLVKRQPKNNKKHNTSRNDASFPIGSTGAVQQKDSGMLTHGTVVRRGLHNHNNRPFMICITKKGQLVTRNSKHIKGIPIAPK